MRDRFAAFVADRLDRLLRYATALTCDPQLAQDIVQDVLLGAQQQWSRIESMAAPDAYVRMMITNEYLSLCRRRASRTTASTHGTLDALAIPTADPAGPYAERDAMRARIATLPRKQRAAILLRYYEDCTDAQIAEVLGCSAGTVRSHISRALSTLRMAHQDRVRFGTIPVGPLQTGMLSVDPEQVRAFVARAFGEDTGAPPPSGARPRRAPAAWTDGIRRRAARARRRTGHAMCG